MDNLLKFLKNKLQDHLDHMFGETAGTVDFPENGNWDPLVFADQHITMLIVNLEEEKTMRADNIYRKVNQNGKSVNAFPEIKLNVYILLVSKFPNYSEAWKQLYASLCYFQSSPVFTSETESQLPPEVAMLIMELTTQSMSDQNEMWSMFKSAYHPSVLYKAKMIIVQNELVSPASEITEIENRVTGS